MAQKLKVGVIGTGMAWEKLHAPAFSELTAQYEVAALCNKTIEKAQAAAKKLNLSQENVYSDYKQMLARTDLDVIDVLVPISENFEVAKDVLLAGKNLIAEKPFASKPESAKELIALKNKNKLKVMVAENFRYDEGNKIIKEILSNKKIGEVCYFVYNTAADFEKQMKTNTFAAKEWRQYPEFSGGIFLDGGIHDIALMRFLFGDAQKVCALGRTQHKPYCPYDTISSLIEFQENIIGSYSFYTGGELQKPPIGFRIFGTQGDIYLESKDCGTVIVNYNNGISERKTYTPNRGYYNELLNFYNGDLISTPEKELGDIQLVYDILNAVENKQTTTL